MRILYARPDLLGDRHGPGISGRVAERRHGRRFNGNSRADRGRDKRANERQSLPLRRIRRNSRGSSRGIPVGGAAMRNFSYSRAGTAQEAVSLISTIRNAKFLGGGTNLVDLMRENI